MVKEKQDNYEIVDVATETQPRIQDPDTKETYTLNEAICKILNELKEVRKVVG